MVVTVSLLGQHRARVNPHFLHFFHRRWPVELEPTITGAPVSRAAQSEPGGRWRRNLTAWNGIKANWHGVAKADRHRTRGQDDLARRKLAHDADDGPALCLGRFRDSITMLLHAEKPCQGMWPTIGRDARGEFSGGAHNQSAF